MILKIAVCDDNDKDIEIINRELLLLEEKARKGKGMYLSDTGI